MSATKTDRAIIASSALVGYCNSVPKKGYITSESWSAWIDGLLYQAKIAGDAIDKVYEQGDGE